MTADPDQEEPPLSQELLQLASTATAERITLQDLLDGIKSHARPTLLILFALPNTIPSIPGTSAITGLPLVYLTLQMMLGWPIQLPAFIGNRSLKRTDLLAVLRRAEPWLARIERILTPRWRVLSTAHAERVLGAFCLALSLLIMAPVPFGNILPSMTIILIALGLMERDGYFIAAGLAFGAAAWGLVGVLYWTLLKALLFVIARTFGQP